MAENSGNTSGKLKNFTPAYDILLAKYGPMTAVVYGYIWRRSQGERKRCDSNRKTIKKLLHIDEKTFTTHARKLAQDGYIRYEERGNSSTLYWTTGKAERENSYFSVENLPTKRDGSEEILLSSGENLPGNVEIFPGNRENFPSQQGKFPYEESIKETTDKSTLNKEVEDKERDASDITDATALFQELEEKGGMYLVGKTIKLVNDEIEEYERSFDAGLRHPWGMIQFCFSLYASSEDDLPKDGRVFHGLFYLSKTEMRKLEKYFSKFPITDKKDEEPGETYKFLEFDNHTYACAVDLYYWKWKSTGKQKVDVNEIIDLFEKGEKYMDAEIIRHPEYYESSKAVRIVAEITKRPVPPELYYDVHKTINELCMNPESEREELAEYWKTWVRRGYKKNNYEWLFDWYANGKDVWNN